jgi:hypothetical protein
MFKQNLPHNKTELTLQEFKKIMPSKNVRHLQQIVLLWAAEGSEAGFLSEKFPICTFLKQHRKARPFQRLQKYFFLQETT